MIYVDAATFATHTILSQPTASSDEGSSSVLQISSRHGILCYCRFPSQKWQRYSNNVFMCLVHIAKAKITTFQAFAMFRTAKQAWDSPFQNGANLSKSDYKLQIHKFHISRRICRVAMEVFGCLITHGHEFGTSRISSTHLQEHQQPSKRISKPSESRGKVRLLPDRRGVSINMAFSFARFFRSNGHLTLHGHQPSNQILEKLHVQCEAQNWK